MRAYTLPQPGTTRQSHLFIFSWTMLAGVTWVNHCEFLSLTAAGALTIWMGSCYGIWNNEIGQLETDLPSLLESREQMSL